jgi:hypothetical protein
LALEAFLVKYRASIFMLEAPHKMPMIASYTTATAAKLYYDADGTGANVQVLFAVLDHHHPARVTASDFVVL